MSSTSQKPEIKLENVALWYKCRECKRCFHSLPLLEQHFMENHKETEFILPANLPPGATKGTIYLQRDQMRSKIVTNKFSSRSEVSELLVNEITANEQPDRQSKIRCEICKKSFKSPSVFNFHIKQQHRNINAAAGSEITGNVQEIGSSSNGITKRNPKTPTTSTENSIGKRRRVLSAKAKAAVDSAKTRNIKTLTKNGKRGLKTANNSNYVLFIKGRVKYYGCPKCPYRTPISGRLDAHVELHQEGSNAISCQRCGWYVMPKGLPTHILRHRRRHPKKGTSQK